MRHAFLSSVSALILGIVLIGIVFPPLTANTQAASPAASPLACVLPQPLADLSSAADDDLKKLGGFQTQFGYIGNQLAFFTVMPVSDADLDEAEGVAAKLKSFAAANIKPVVFIEPPEDQSIADIVDSVTKVPWEAYFDRIKATGITSAQMGLWIPYPEFNTPIWNRAWSKPSDFSTLMNNFSSAYKKVFPGARAGILLNSFSYEPDDVHWERGKVASHLPYVSGIKKGNVDVVAMQAFPWFPRKNQEGKKPLEYAPRFVFMRILAEAATAVGTKGIMIHSGTPASMHAGSVATQVFITPSKRAAILRGIMTMARTYKRLGWNVSVSLFTEDKSKVGEGTDWSYNKDAAYALKQTARTAYCNKIPLVMF